MDGLDESHKWKMRTARNFIVYMAYPILNQFRNDFTIGKFLLKYQFLFILISCNLNRRLTGFFIHRQARRLAKGIRLISGFSSLPVDEQKAEESRKLIRLFFKDMVKKYDDLYGTYTHHNFLHVVEDLIRFRCHLDRNSSYDFETYHQQYKRLFKPGPKAHIQIKYVAFIHFKDFNVSTIFSI
jgi:hypothetical protein